MSNQKIYISEPEETVADASPAAPKSTRKKTTAKSAKSADVPYEVAVARLEEIVRKLEQSREGIGLEESMKLYEEGVSLVRRCYQELEAAEQRVKVLQEMQDGEIQAVPFDTSST